MQLVSRSPEATRRLGAALADVVGDEGAVVVLAGPLGAGKTQFVKGVAEGFGLPPERVQSPTFVIAHELTLASGRSFVHVDCYRVASEAELEAAGLLDWLAPGAVVLAEWGDRFPDAWPSDRLEVSLARGEARTRTLVARAGGPRSAALLQRWRDVRPDAASLASGSA